MEVAMGALALFGSGSAAAAGTAAAGAATLGSTVATAGATAASWAGIGSTALSVIQGVMTAGSVLGMLSGASISNDETQLQASAVDLQSREEAVRIRTEELQKIGAARVAFAGSGVSLASGDVVEGSLREQSGFEQELSRNSGAVKSAQIRLSGKGKMVGAMGDAAGSIANYALSLASRG
jgi:hypothetical protein